MPITNKELNNLSAQKHMIIRNFDQKYINEDTYKKQLYEIEQRINSKVKALIEENKKGISKKKDIPGENKMSDEIVEKKKIGRKPAKNSNASVIAEVLQMKTVKDMNAVADKVMEKKPGLEKAKVITQAKTIIREVKNGKGRWAAYNWDAEAFLLTEKQ